VSPLPAHLGPGGMYSFTLAFEDAGDGKRLMLRYELFQGEAWERYDASEPKSAVLSGGLQDAQFDYFGQHNREEPAGWRTQWQEKERLPRLVRLRLLPASGMAEEFLMAPKLGARPKG
jgi:general secretion pathway protein J